jgi:hypothetical protein
MWEEKERSPGLSARGFFLLKASVALRAEL